MMQKDDVTTVNAIFYRHYHCLALVKITAILFSSIGLQKGVCIVTPDQSFTFILFTNRF